MHDGHTHDDDVLPPRPIDRLISPFQGFARHKLAGAMLLIVSTVAAVVWANSPWAEAYHGLLHTPVGVSFADLGLEKTLHHWINDGLMGIFFFLVGLEIKREVLAGELATVRKATLPAIAALGGMVVPAGLYVALNPSGAAASGWGIPMATDIAFALGVLALLGDRVPLGLKVFLTALVIVDDIGAVLVIAVFYTDSLSIFGLVAGFLFLAVAVAANVLQVRNSLFYFFLGSLVWLAFLQSGVHATIAAILMAFTIPARTRIDGADFVRKAQALLDRLKAVGVPQDHSMNTHEQQLVLDKLATRVEQAGAPLQRLEHALNPLVTFIVLPIFALANAGVSLDASLGQALTASVTLGVIAGLVIGKPIGIGLFAWIAVKLGVADLPSNVRWPQLWGVGLLGGIGFTMSLFIAGLAFDDAATLERAKVGILAASLVAGVVGYLLVRAFSSRERAVPDELEAEAAIK
ncbi:MAG: Na+/H+ antiporter NhaA [Myxococcota bacterium]|nr:Na+/H+ antiporter NhaA [Myxococcota bacterium]